VGTSQRSISADQPSCVIEQPAWVFPDRVVRISGHYAVTVIAFAVSALPLWLITSSMTFSLFAALYVPSLSIYAAELFPTRARNSATSGTWAINRVGSALGPLVLLTLLHTCGIIAMFAVIAATLAGTILLILIVGPRGMARRPVD
jgi:putative MFS transporter